MARKKTSMRYVKEMLRLKLQYNLSVRQIARSCGLPSSTVGDYLNQAKALGLELSMIEEMSEEQINELLMKPPSDSQQEPPAKAIPDWAVIHQELGRKNVTLKLLWQEYRQTHPQGYNYSRFCELYKCWTGKLDPVMRQVHVPGEKLFVDWAGDKVPIHCSDGSTSQASLFVAVMGASNKIYVEAFENEKLENWILGHCHAFAFFGGVTRAIVPDNPKTAVLMACRYEPRLHESYAEMARHYQTVVLPARIRRPKDKAKVETAVQISQRQILAALRDLRFFSVGELNTALKPRLEKINAEPFQKLEGSRNSLFEEKEKDKLLPLPSLPYELATWTHAKANIDYHVVVDYHYYSVPYQYIHEQLQVRKTARTVEIFHKGKRVAAHQRSSLPGKFTTLEEHRPKTHQRYLEWTPSRLIEWANKTGPNCGKVIEEILKNHFHPEQGFRSCLGIMRLSKTVGGQRMEAACQRALKARICSYRSIKSILENRLDQLALEEEETIKSPSHKNLRGKDYYRPEEVIC